MDVAVIGTGLMGAGMARSLLREGHTVRVWNRTRARAEALADVGAVVCDTPADAAMGVQVAFTMLADGEATEAVLGGPEGLLTGLAVDAIWVQAGTVGIDAADRFARRAEAEGVLHVDAPVLGTKKPAEDGALLIIAAGAEQCRERVQPAFDAIGRKTMWVGSAGAASRLKLVANGWILGLLGALGESIAMAEGLGLDPRHFLDAISGSAVDAGYAHIKGDMMVDRAYPVSFPLRLALKDARLIAAARREAGVPEGLHEAMVEHLARAVQDGHGSVDMAAVVEAVRP